MKKYKICTTLLVTIFTLTVSSFIIKAFIYDSVVTPKSNSKETLITKPEVTKDTTNETVNIQNKSNGEVKEINGFVLLSSMDKDIFIDLKYATTDNFTKKVIYPNNICVLRKSTAKKLVNANTELMKFGYKLKVWDAYRPIYVQQIFWDIVKDSRFVANPKTGGSIHNIGCAVDVTLVGLDGNELTMPSKFDDFSPNAYRTNSKISTQAKKNLELLTKCMVDNGFKTINTEWWHFEDTDSGKYKNADIDLNRFVK